MAEQTIPTVTMPLPEARRILTYLQSYALELEKWYGLGYSELKELHAIISQLRKRIEGSTK